MGLLDPKERILDIVLTDKGREFMSKNQLNFVYYAFSDEGVDYSGSLSASNNISGSTLDNYLFRNLSFEPDQRKNKDLNSFLYTVPSKEDILPEFRISHNTGSDLVLERRFYINNFFFFNRPRSFIQRPIAVVARASIPQKTLGDRQEEYVLSQRIRDFKNKQKDASINLVGLPIGKNLTLVSSNKVLDKETGIVMDVNSPKVKQQIEQPSLKGVSFKKEVEYVTGISRAKIDLSLANSKGPVNISSGFLVEVFDSGSDGKLTRLFKEDLVDAVNDKTLSDGFTNFIKLEVDE